MERVRLPGTELETSVLGFGCAPLMRRLGRRESVRKLEQAHELGITHFDTARSYGYGEAEGMLGDFLAGKRDLVTVTTKLGIVPPRRTAALSVAKAAARRLVGRSPRLRAAVRRRANASTTPGHFGVREAERSLDMSLRELRTDRVDILLLHDCREEDLQSDDLLAFLERSVRDGKIRYFGIGTDLDSSRRILASRPAYAPIVQLPHSIVERNLEHLPDRDSRAIVSHSAIRAGLGDILRHLESAPDRARAWSAAVGADCSDPGVVASLMLAYAVQSNPSGIVLYSSQVDHHIRTAVTAIAEQRFSPGQVERLAQLVQEDRPLIAAR